MLYGDVFPGLEKTDHMRSKKNIPKLLVEINPSGVALGWIQFALSSR